MSQLFTLECPHCGVRNYGIPSWHTKATCSGCANDFYLASTGEPVVSTEPLEESKPPECVPPATPQSVTRWEVRGVPFSPKKYQEPPNDGEGWAPIGVSGGQTWWSRAVDCAYDENFGDDRVCKCGHSYYRHFDWADEYRPGCKYCVCHFFEEKL